MSEQENTIFHRIIRGEIPAKIVYEDKLVVAFRDVNPVSPSHVLIVPRKTLPSLKDTGKEDAELLGHMMLVARQIAHDESGDADGYRLVMNIGKHGGQSVMQMHLHVLCGRPFSWPPG